MKNLNEKLRNAYNSWNESAARLSRERVDSDLDEICERMVEKAGLGETWVDYWIPKTFLLYVALTHLRTTLGDGYCVNPSTTVEGVDHDAIVIDFSDLVKS